MTSTVAASFPRCCPTEHGADGKSARRGSRTYAYFLSMVRIVGAEDDDGKTASQVARYLSGVWELLSEHRVE
jgi:hypothetical protein